MLLPLACVLGAAFPIGAALAARSDEGVTRDVSLVYGINTIGAVAGSLGGAFVLLPLLGLQQTLHVAGVLALGAGCLAFVAGRLSSRQRVMTAATAVATAVLIFAMPAWDIDLLSSGGYTYAADVDDPELDLATSLKAGTVLYYKEGATATVSVRRLAGTVALAIDGKVDASNWADMLTQKLLAHLPLLLHPDPHDVCIIGLGSGVTLGAALRHRIDRADVVEISAEVVEASSFFADDNGLALEDPRTRLIVGDGRSHLQLSAEQYDVIISQPSNPWMAGVAALFTREFFLAARERLTPGGIFCQWAHTYDIADADLRSIAATFMNVFPNGTLWLVGTPARRSPAPARLALARLLAAAGAFDAAVAHAEEAIAAEPDNPRGLESLASILGDAGDVDRLRPLVTRMQETRPEREETLYYAALASFLGGDLPDAIARAQQVTQVNPRHAAAHNLVGAANATLGFRDRARQAFRASLEADPRDPATYTNLAFLEMESGDRDAAAAYFAESLSLDPRNEMARASLAAAGR